MLEGLKVTLLRADVPVRVPPMVVVIPVKYMVPELWANVPELLYAPPTVMAEGAVIEPLVIVRFPVVEALFEKVHAPPVPLKIIFLNAEDPVRILPIVFPVVVALNVTVLLLLLNVLPVSLI